MRLTNGRSTARSSTRSCTSWRIARWCVVLGAIAAGRLLVSASYAAPGPTAGRDVVPAASIATGQIAGKVVSALTSEGIEGIEVCAFENILPEGPLEGPFEGLFEEPSVRCGRTNAVGEYALAELAPGEYDVEFSAPAESNLNYITQYYNEEPAFGLANPVTVVAGQTTFAINAKMRVGGKIEGTVTSAETKDPVSRIIVCASDEERLESEVCETTNPDGEYTMHGLPAGSYRMRFEEPFEESRNYATQYYNGKAARSEAETVTVAVGETKQGVNAALLRGGQITGTVTTLLGGARLGDIEVCAVGTSEALFRCSITNADGEYDLTSLSTASYKIGFHSLSGEYATQYYDEVPTRAEARPVFVEAGKITQQINAALKPGIPADLTRPRISGNPVQGQTLQVVHGAWTDRPTAYQDEWGRCNGAGELKTWTTIATGQSYTLTAADVGHAIRVRERASNEGGEGEFVYSTPTAAVMAAPPPPSPAVAVLGTTTAVTSAAQVRALLISILVPTGRAARIRTLLKRDGYTISFSAFSAGDLRISWYLVPKGARLATRRPTLVAIGRASFTKAGATKIEIKLTGRGRLLLRHANRLRLTARGSLTPSGQGAVSAIKSFTLKR